ncbi:MAG: hypothetical protein C0501_20255 [Isosphaera sp.]|nr:hypothetical protein [Isosphaera sp.]
MAVTLKCPDCGHTAAADDDTPQTCPKCDGTMTRPKYKAKSGPAEVDAPRKAAPKPPPRRRDEDDEDDRPRPAARRRDEDDEDRPPPRRAKPAPRADDEEDDGGGGSARDGRAAESLELDPGFRNRALMRQVEDELARGEVLHWAARPCLEIAKRKGRMMLIFGLVFALIGAAVSTGMFLAKGIPWYIGLFPLLFVLIGIGVAIFGPRAAVKQAEKGWYAVTDRRAVVFTVGLFGDSGQTESYEPRELRRMRVQKAKSPPGAGDLVFKTKVTEKRTDYVDRRTGQTVKSETSRSETNYGFIGIENVREVETLVHNVLLDPDRDDD